MNPQEIARRRLQLQHLVTPVLTKPADIVRMLGAVQAQDYPGAKWAIGQRAVGLLDADIETSFAAGDIIRTHVLRPTWHFVAPEDLRWTLALTGPRVKAAMASYNRKMGLDAKVFRRSNATLERVLGNGEHLTRAEIATALRTAKVNVATGQHVAHLLMQAELDGVICSGPRRAKQFTYALLELRVPAARGWDRDESLIELARRYFATRGPATVHDFSWWSGLVMADAKRALEGLGATVGRVMIDGRPFWFDPSRAFGGRSKPTVHLLPNYDEYFIGFKDRGAIGARLRRTLTTPRVDALMGHILCIDGQIVGGWKRASTRRGGVEFEMLAPLTGAEQKRVKAEVERFDRFLGLRPR